jgi:serine/threonine-protein kinase PpkA
MSESTSLQIPGYRISRVLGQGGMAAVYLAIQESFEREVALKVLPPSLASDNSFTERFIHEAKIVSRLVHPNIVTVYDVGVVDEHYYLSMEYVPGQDLKQARHRLTLSQRLQVVKDIALALEFAGKKGCVHRDVKPENIMLHAEDGRAVLMDFGIARTTDVSMGMTQTGTAIGTPHYMSPEQARGKSVDGRADIYSLGVVLYLLLAGEVPFDADSAVAIGIKHVSEPIPRLPTELHDFQALLNKCLSKKPEHRFQTGVELIAALDDLNEQAISDAANFITVQSDNFQSTVDTRATTVLHSGAVENASGDGTTQLASAAAEAVDADVITADVLDRVDTIIEPARTPWWSWVAGVGVAASVAFGVFYQQRLPDSVRLPIASAVAASHSQLEKTVTNTLADDGVIQAPGTTEEPASSKKPIGIAAEEQNSVAFNESAEKTADAETLINETAATESVSVEQEPVLVQTLEVKLQSLSERQSLLADDVELAPALADDYRQLLGQYPESAETRQGLKQLREFLGREVQQSIEARDLTKAKQLVDVVGQTFPRIKNEPRFLRWTSRLQQAQALQQHLESAETAIENNQLSEATQAFNAARDIDAENPLIKVGFSKIAQQYAQHGQALVEQGQWQQAQASIVKGLALAPEQPLLRQLSRRIDKQRQLDTLIKRAVQYSAKGYLISPANQNAAAIYRAVLEEYPSHHVAVQGLRKVELGLVDNVQALHGGGNLDGARTKALTALEAFPHSHELQALKADIDQRVAEAIAETQPRVPKILVSNTTLSSIVEDSQATLAVDRVLHVGFQFENFEADNSVVQAILFDGARSLQIAQVPVILSGHDGVQFFRIERPVEGFGDGGYSIDLVLGDQRLSSTTFEVKNTASF